MSKIPTAEEKLKAIFYNGSFIEIHSGDAENIKNIMIEFAQLHVQAALEAACDNSCVTTEGRGFAAVDVVDKASIQEAYPLINIK